jgi:carboxypeptidase C (cathepsin A)
MAGFAQSQGLGAPADEIVKSIPGYGDFSNLFKVYSGYVPTKCSNPDDLSTCKHHLHYIFVESADSPADDPVQIWFNGGPGCSSMLGFAQENGPFMNDDGE